ncbi:hypothetical protein F53441_11984 [Fusarium austroafricanum]|uniref:Uncharacterized protein n=1 Tax=Fusarium austroafricanum TaxID=2364996 RepID=A0A8H4JYZ4_9HYPO|nr:hypothetical protein F53441_11984 [Fusarium austroafricanum]
MAAPSCIDINQTKAVVEWQWEGVTRTLATADPDHDAIRFTLQLDSSKNDSQSCAHFEISIPFRFKDKPAGAGVCLRINPFFIKSINYSTLSNPSDAVKQIFDSTTYLDLELDNRITVLVPSDVKEPVVAARARSGKVLDSLYELSCVTSLRIYIQESLLSLDELKSIRETVEQRQIKPSSDPDHDISRMFSGSGGKVATIAPPKPPSYEKATKLPPNAPPSNRKRPRQDSQSDIFTQFWDKLNKLEAKVGELQADNAHLRVENIQLKDKVARLEKRCEGLETQAALSLGNGNDTEEATMIEIRDDIDSLNGRVTAIESGRDEEFSEQIKEEIFDELAKRLLGG